MELRKSLEKEKELDEFAKPPKRAGDPDDEDDVAAPRPPVLYPVQHLWLKFLRYMDWADETVLFQQRLAWVHECWETYKLLNEFDRLERLSLF